MANHSKKIGLGSKPVALDEPQELHPWPDSPERPERPERPEKLLRDAVKI
jgi:hypothetical protein